MVERTIYDLQLGGHKVYKRKRMRVYWELLQRYYSPCRKTIQIRKKMKNTVPVSTAGEDPILVVGFDVLVTDLAGGIRFRVKPVVSSGKALAGCAGVLNLCESLRGSITLPEIG